MIKHYYASREEAAAAVTTRIASALRRKLDTPENPVLIVPGGSTPKPVFRELSQVNLAWHRVQVLLSDERWVPNDHEASNEKLIRDALLINHAVDAQLFPYFQPYTDIENRCKTINDMFASLKNRLVCALLGMGEDGHFASLFPDLDKRQAGLDPDATRSCLAISTAASPYQRISLTLSALTMSEEIILFIYGAAKRAVIEKAGEPDSDLPVAHLLNQGRVPIQIFWAP